MIKKETEKTSKHWDGRSTGTNIEMSFTYALNSLARQLFISDTLTQFGLHKRK